MWLYRPSSNRWSIHEIIHHLADREATGYVQCRMYIAEPGSRALRPDAARWANSLGYFHHSVWDALNLIHRLRKATYEVLVNLPDDAWFHSVENPNGTQSYLEHWLDQQEGHIPHHLEQMRQNYEEWSKNETQRQTGAPQHARAKRRRQRSETRPPNPPFLRPWRSYGITGPALLSSAMASWEPCHWPSSTPLLSRRST